MRERSGRQDVQERSGPNGLARRASAANATNESGGEAKTPDGSGGLRDRRELRSLRRPSERLTAKRRVESRGCGRVEG
jgi:hypothetical protein